MKKNSQKRIPDVLTRSFTLQKTVVRLFSSLFATCALFSILASPVKFTSADFFTSVGTAPFFACFASAFILLCFIFTVLNSLKAERLILLLTYIAYACICTFNEHSAWFGLGASLILLVICVYIFRDDDAPVLKRDVKNVSMIVSSAFAGIYFMLFIGAQTVCRYLTQSTPAYDFGIFSQMFYYMRTTLLPLVTCERDALLSHFAVHMSPVYYLFLPFYAIWPSPATLLICQAVLLASGVIPVAMLCKRAGLSNKSTAAFALIYSLYPALGGGCYYDLHENKFLAPLLLWLFYFIEKNKWYGILIFSALTLTVKEDAVVYVVFAGVYMLLSRGKNKIAGGAMILVSALYFAFCIVWLTNFGDGVMEYRYENFMSRDKSGLFYVVINVFKDPAYVIQQIFSDTADKNVSTKLEFILQMLLPLGALPVITKKLERYVLLLPLVLINLMPSYPYQHSIYFQYTYGALAFLIYAAIINYSDMKPQTKRIMAVFAVCSSVFLCNQTIWQRSNYLKSYIENKQTYDSVREAIEAIPEDAAVGASTFYVSTASDHKILYHLKYTSNFDKIDYAVIDLRYQNEISEYLWRFEDSPDFEEIYRQNGRLVIYRRIK